MVIIASKAGAPTNPDWYHNLKANPSIEVEVGTETFRVATEEEMAEVEPLWRRRRDRRDTPEPTRTP